MQSNVVGIVPIHNITDFLHLQQNRFSTPPPEHTHADKLLLFNSQAKKAKPGFYSWCVRLVVVGGAMPAYQRVPMLPTIILRLATRECVPPYRVSPPIPYTHIERQIVTGHLCLGFLYSWFVHSNYTRRNRKSLFRQ